MYCIRNLLVSWWSRVCLDWLGCVGRPRADGWSLCSWGLCSEMLDLSVRRVCPVRGPVWLMVCVGHCSAPFTSGWNKLPKELSLVNLNKRAVGKWLWGCFVVTVSALFVCSFFFNLCGLQGRFRACGMRLPDTEGSEHTTLRLVSACAVRLASDVCTLNRSACALLPCERRKCPCPACIKCALKVPAALLSAYSSVLQHCLHTVARSDYSDSRWC